VLYTLWAAKGGTGCTTVAVALAAHLASAASTDGVLIVDLGGDVPAATGLADPGAGLTDWLALPTAEAAALGRLEVGVGRRPVHVLPLGGAAAWADDRADDLVALIRRERRSVVVDAGVVGITAGGPLGRLRAAFAAEGASYLVTRACYLALRRAAALSARPDGIVLVREHGRGLDRHDVRDILHAPIIAELDHDPAVARAVDAGLLVRGRPRTLVRQMRGLAS
jgi:hypothetical protein